MRRVRVPAGRVLGIRLWLHPSWFLVLGLVVWATSVAFGEVYPRLAAPVRGAMGLVTGVAFFACLTVHEVAHALTARRFGIGVRGITLFLFGGVAEIDREVPTPAGEFAVALVGPAVSIVLGAVFGLAALAAVRSKVAEGILGTLALVNLGVCVFNLVPGLPLDGGRLLRAAIWRLTGSYARGTRIASGAGRAIAVVLVGVGVFLVAVERDLFGIWYVPLGFFLWFLARAASRRLRPEGALALGDREGEAPQSGP